MSGYNPHLKEKALSKVPECNLWVDFTHILRRFLTRIGKNTPRRFFRPNVIECRQKCLFRQLYKIIGSPQSLHEELKISRRVSKIAGSLCFGHVSLLSSV